jgi:hypothetical protein
VLGRDVVGARADCDDAVAVALETGHFHPFLDTGTPEGGGTRIGLDQTWTQDLVLVGEE